MYYTRVQCFVSFYAPETLTHSPQPKQGELLTRSRAAHTRAAPSDVNNAHPCLPRVIVACCSSAFRFVAEMVPGREMSDYRRFEQAFLRGPFDAARKGDAETLRLLRSHG